MNTQLIEEVKSTVKNWWVSLVLGILFIAVALMMMFYLRGLKGKVKQHNTDSADK